MRIAVIPARGGSKRIPRKNIKPFAGKPMIAYAIDAALRSDLFARVLVTTDDDEIAAIARECGAETPFSRPATLADDHTPTAPVIAHAISACEGLGWYAELVCCIYPAVPFIQTDDLKQGLALLENTDSDYCFPVTEYPSAVQRALGRTADGKMFPLFPTNELTRTQDLEAAYFDVGQFYWGQRLAWLANSHIHSGGIGLPIPSWRAVDIDTLDDWLRAETMHQSLFSGR